MPAKFLIPALAVLTALVAPAAATETIDPLALVGQWSDDGDCGNVTELRADGTFVAPNGGRGAWELRGTTLVLAGARGSVNWTVTLEDADTRTRTGEHGGRTRSYRCPALAPAVYV